MSEEPAVNPNGRSGEAKAPSMTPAEAHRFLMALVDTPIAQQGAAEDSPVTVRRSSQGASPLERKAWPHLDGSAVEVLRAAGQTRTTQSGDVLFELDAKDHDFLFVEQGSVAVVDRADDHTVTEVMAGDFVGEIGMLIGERTFFAGVVAQAGQVIVVGLSALRELIEAEPEIGDKIVTAFAARRELLEEWGEGQGRRQR